jgi:hypothetical protein
MASCTTLTPRERSSARRARSRPGSRRTPTRRAGRARHSEATEPSGDASRRKSSPVLSPATGAAASSPRTIRRPPTTSFRKSGAAQTMRTTWFRVVGAVILAGAARCARTDVQAADLHIYPILYKMGPDDPRPSLRFALVPRSLIFWPGWPSRNATGPLRRETAMATAQNRDFTAKSAFHLAAGVPDMIRPRA